MVVLRERARRPHVARQASECECEGIQVWQSAESKFASSAHRVGAENGNGERLNVANGLRIRATLVQLHFLQYYFL